MFSGVLSCTDTKTQSETQIYNPETTVGLIRDETKRALSGLHIGVQLCVLLYNIDIYIISLCNVQKTLTSHSKWLIFFLHSVWKAQLY